MFHGDDGRLGGVPKAKAFPLREACRSDDDGVEGLQALVDLAGGDLLILKIVRTLTKYNDRVRRTKSSSSGLKEEIGTSCGPLEDEDTEGRLRACDWEASIPMGAGA